ncbi:MAG: hypothetical protein M3033_03345 [Acidobacteriota bacterium]|nr:hypothetical protein [Acidobacteriota bacterium]
MIEFLADEANKNLLLGGVPESIGLLIFGVILIVSAVSLRRLFNENEKKLNFDGKARKINREERVLVGK